MEYKLGLDIGIASVGWAVVDSEDKVIECGSRLFESADASQNEERRGFRAGRRLVRRRQHRVNRVNKLLEKNGINKPEKLNINTLYLRNKALKDKISEEEIYCVLTYLVKCRGISYLEDAIDDDNKKGSAFQNALLENAEQSKTKLPCEIQLERLENYGKFRGEVEVGDMIYSNVFTISAYKEEISRIFEEQRKYHNFITDEFIEEYNKIHNIKREYYVGPGNEKSRTNYGRYRLNETVDNIFSNLIGKCSVYNGKDGKEEELRASGASYTAQEFNVLNDLNNLTINGSRKLIKSEKVEIIKNIKKETSKSDLTFNKIKGIIEKVIGEKITVVSGARIDKSNKEIFHSFTAYRVMKKYLGEIDFDIDSFSRDELDEIAHTITINKDKESITKALNKLNNEKITKEVIEELVKLRKENSSSFTKWQSLSTKIMNEVMEQLYDEPKNQMAIFTEMGVFKEKTEIFKDYKYIPRDLIIDEIYNPIVKRAVIQSIKIINAVIKKYGYPTDIVVEMAREKNEKDKKDRITKFQGKNEKELGGIITELEKIGINLSDKDFYNHKDLKTKLRLWKEQGEKCLYSGEKIRAEELIKYPNNFDIDHIIPISISFDDSRSNKVLVYKEENRIKGNRTPYVYLNGLNRQWNYNSYKSYVLSIEKVIGKNKRNNLLFEGDITKEEVRKAFKARNLNDTRYAGRVVLNTLQSFMKAQEKNTKVQVLNGAFTNQIRRRLVLKKDRDISYSHHAVDAIILCYAKSSLKNFQKDYEDKIIDRETGEVLSNKDFYEAGTLDYDKYIVNRDIRKLRDEINRAEKEVKYSHKVDRKVNRALCKQTIYSTRKYDDGEYVVSKIKNIYDDKEYDKIKKIIDKDETQFLMCKHDPKTWESIKRIINDYSDHKNPFLAYKKEHGVIRKYSKKGNGAPINSLKYSDKKLGSHIDITNNYDTKDRKVVLMSLSPYRADVYYNNNTKKYHIVGIKYSDLKFEKGKYLLSENKYNDILVKEKVISTNETIEDLEKLNIEFKFSLYKNDIVQYTKNGEVYTDRFLSKGSTKNAVELKPLDKSQFIDYDKDGNIKRDKNNNVVFKRKRIPFSSDTTFIKKINVDILGNQHIIEKEKFKIEVFVDNKMIK